MAERGKGFPRLSLSGAIKVVDTASKFGKSWPKEQFAGFGSQSRAASAKSGAFAVRVSSLRDYGLITTDKNTISLTELGLKIAKPVTSSEREQAIEQAFLNVKPFKQLIEGLDSDTALSTDQVAQYAVFNLGISRESKDKFISVFVDSGHYVKLVEYNKESSTIMLRGVRHQHEDDSITIENDEQDEGTPQGPTVNPPVVFSTLEDTSTIRKSPSSPSTEQGVNYSGEGWVLTVMLKTTMLLDATTRKKLRDLLEQADELSDQLHSLEEKG